MSSAIRTEPDPRRKLAIYARATREIHARLAPLLLALRDASTTEPEARAVWDEISERRAMNMRELAKDLDSVGGIRAGLTIADAADTIWVTNSAEVYTLLTVRTGLAAAPLRTMADRHLVPPPPTRQLTEPTSGRRPIFDRATRAAQSRAAGTGSIATETVCA